MADHRIPPVNLPTISNVDSKSDWQPKAILFDLLTGLLDSWTLWNHAATSPERGREWRARYLEITFGCGSYKPYEDLVEQSAREVGLPSEAPATLLREWDSLKPWPEVEGVLKRLREKGYKLGVVTNCSRELGPRAAAKAGTFDVVLTAEEIG
jgi:2-haloacid dehalogenase